MEKARPKTASLYDEGINKNNYINIDKNPPVGYYDPDRIYTVKQNVLNKLKQGNRTFNSTLLSDRNAIYQFQKNAPNGPGTYFKNEKNNIYKKEKKVILGRELMIMKKKDILG